MSPNKPLPLCRYPLYPSLAEKGNYYSLHNGKAKLKEPRTTSIERGYNYPWQKVRRMYLKENPLCIECITLGIITPASLVDHIEPHKGDYDKFWDENNMQSLCETCHNKKTGRGA